MGKDGSENNQEKRTDRKKRWSAPSIESDTIYETRALGCGKCTPESPYFDSGCMVSQSDY
jgi:hypothetical protein